MLEKGREASEVISKYMEGTNTRITKLSDVKTKIQSVPSSDRTEIMTKSIPYLFQNICLLEWLFSNMLTTFGAFHSFSFLHT